MTWCHDSTSDSGWESLGCDCQRWQAEAGRVWSSGCIRIMFACQELRQITICSAMKFAAFWKAFRLRSDVGFWHFSRSHETLNRKFLMKHLQNEAWHLISNNMLRFKTNTLGFSSVSSAKTHLHYNWIYCASMKVFQKKSQKLINKKTHPTRASVWVCLNPLFSWYPAPRLHYVGFLLENRFSESFQAKLWHATNPLSPLSVFKSAPLSALS